jgi:hypothetical protein
MKQEKDKKAYSSNELITELGLKVSSELWKYIVINNHIKKQNLLSHHYNIAFNDFRKWFKEDIMASEIRPTYG